MNPFGSYQRLRDNAIAAMVGSIEIYNKPRFAYRDECSVILMINAWELLLKATLSKARLSIYYPKRRGEPYRTLSWTDAARRLMAERKWPAELLAEHHAIVVNIDLLDEYRNNSVHFYNARDFGLVTHSLAQQSILNFRDFLRAAFKKELADDISWALMPLGTTPPVDPISYLQREGSTTSAAVRDFLDAIEGSVAFLSSVKSDPSRLMTHLPIHLISTKKSGKAAVSVGVGSSSDAARAIVRRVDPNTSHPLRMTDVVERVGATVAGRPFTRNTFIAIVDHLELRMKDHLFFKPRAGAPQWSEDVVSLIRGLSADQIDAARAAFRLKVTKRKPLTAGS